MSSTLWKDRRDFIGGSDARIIMGDNEAALICLWREKRGEAEPEDLSGNLLVQLGLATEDLNRRWYEANTGQVITDVQRKIRHPALRWMGATLDGRIEGSDAVLTGGGKWVEIVAHADPLYQHLIVTAERKFWRCVETGEQPQLFGVEPPKPRLEAVRVVDMGSSNAWSEFATIFTRTHQAHLEHEHAKAELKSLVPEDAKEAVGHGVRAKRSKAGAISFDLAPESDYAAV